MDLNDDCESKVPSLVNFYIAYEDIIVDRNTSKSSALNSDSLCLVERCVESPVLDSVALVDKLVEESPRLCAFSTQLAGCTLNTIPASDALDADLNDRPHLKPSHITPATRLAIPDNDGASESGWRSQSTTFLPFRGKQILDCRVDKERVSKSPPCASSTHTPAPTPKIISLIPDARTSETHRPLHWWGQGQGQQQSTPDVPLTIQKVGETFQEPHTYFVDSYESHKKFGASLPQAQEGQQFVYSGASSHPSPSASLSGMKYKTITLPDKSQLHGTITDTVNPTSELRQEASTKSKNPSVAVPQNMCDPSESLSTGSRRGECLRKAWQLDPSLPEHLHSVADLEKNGLVRLQRILIVLKMRGYLDWTTEEITRTCALLASKQKSHINSNKKSGYGICESGHLPVAPEWDSEEPDTRGSGTQIEIEERNSEFYINSGATFALLRALLML